MMEGKFDLANDTVKCALLAAYTLDEDGHSKWTDVSTKEIADGSYGQAALAGLSVTSTGTSGTTALGQWDASDVTFSSLTGTDPNYAVLMDDTVTAPADALIGAWELTTTTNGGNYRHTCSPCW